MFYTDGIYLVMKVIIVKEVMTCDVWPVAMFTQQIIVLFPTLALGTNC